MLKLSSAIFVIALSLVACQNRSSYSELVEEEMSSGVRIDTLFLGFHFGMTAGDFYDRCWKLNKEGLLREGPSNTTVYYKLEGLPYAAGFEFWPVFKDDRIQAMTAFAYYSGWAPWNRDLWSDIMIDELKGLLEDWYGEGFIPVPSPGRGKAYVRVKGNLQIALWIERDERVEILFSDLTNDVGVLKF